MFANTNGEILIDVESKPLVRKEEKTASVNHVPYFTIFCLLFINVETLFLFFSANYEGQPKHQENSGATNCMDLFLASSGVQGKGIASLSYLNLYNIFDKAN
ncbi:Hypothetical predicted protein [Olea europaea subsp. europaea]|uniref:Uncharacterized protein n=1 Tax=Olea europaea subsp. europaea TaxID=158383 RepID=A0A8S0VI21_OLEEU|nr:Hypothetical predicted protein [Olea europaea subsp. europaea]